MRLLGMRTDRPHTLSLDQIAESQHAESKLVSVEEQWAEQKKVADPVMEEVGRVQRVMEERHGARSH
jgi:hypothetical protein